MSPGLLFPSSLVLHVGLVHSFTLLNSCYYMTLPCDSLEVTVLKYPQYSLSYILKILFTRLKRLKKKKTNPFWLIKSHLFDSLKVISWRWLLVSRKHSVFYLFFNLFSHVNSIFQFWSVSTVLAKIHYIEKWVMIIII